MLQTKSLLRMSLLSVIAIGVAGSTWEEAAGQSAAGAPKGPRPKVILLGFDGVDAELAKRWMDDGSLPNLAKLAERGTFAPLGTANPAQSPVSWAVMETASNPGKTNVPDFVRRGYTSDGAPMPKLAGVERRMVDASEVGDYVILEPAEKLVFWAASGANGKVVVAGFAVLVLVLLFAIGRFALRMRTVLAALLGGVGGAVGAYVASNALEQIPPRFPVPVSEMQGERFWDVLAKSGVRFAGLQVPAGFPAKAVEGVRMLAGLFTPDVVGGPGAWAIFTNDEWASSKPVGTDTGGKIYKIWEDKEGAFVTKLNGPENFVKLDAFDRRLSRITALLGEPGLGDADRERQTIQRDRLLREREDWELEQGRNASVEMVIRPDFEKRVAKITIDGQTQEIAEGKWSDYFRAKFHLNDALGVEGIPRVYVQMCRRDADDNERLELFVPAVSISPEVQPPNLPISFPREYASELAEAIGLYDTIGWACYTNALKDEEIDERAFLEGLEHTLTWRTKQLEYELSRDDWDVLFHVESVTDRAGHMLYRFLDEQHPQHELETKDGRKVRDLEMTAYGRTFALKDGIRETYKEMDRVVGSVQDRIDAGKFGDNAVLMVISDHGFDSFRYGVNLNNWLKDHGYMVTSGQAQAGNVGMVASGQTGDMLSYVDWTQTKAYSMGLGKIYINLRGRDQLGIVEPGDFAALKKEIIAKLEAYTDPRKGFENQSVVKRAYDAADIYSGAYSEEPGDIILGFDSGYRVSWQTTLGGLEKNTVDDNKAPWTGDHCGVDPSLVEGIFFSNRKLPVGAAPSLLHIAPTILAIYGVERPAEWDGTPLELQ
jgi:predicted AlkP superfamily phosphohydrolase/phosphomutase